MTTRDLNDLTSLTIMEAAAIADFMIVELEEYVKELNILGDPRNYPDFNTRFSVGRIPFIDLKTYINRMVKYIPCSIESVFILFVFLKRLRDHAGPSFINPFTVHRIVITGLLIAAKYHDDIYFNNKYYARVGGISLREMNMLELEFLARIQFNLFLSQEEEDIVLFKLKELSESLYLE